MEIIKVNEYLVDIMNRYSKEGSEKIIAKYSKLKTSNASENIETDNNIYKSCKEKLKDKTKIFEDEKFKLISFEFFIGINNNPVVVELIFEENNVIINTYAKEGFIFQNSAKNAIKSIKKYLEII